MLCHTMTVSEISPGALGYLHGAYNVELGVEVGSGGFNTVFATQPDIGLTVRMPRYREDYPDQELGRVSSGKTRMGTEVLAYLQETASSPPPLPIPTYEDTFYDDHGPYFVMLGRLQGEALSDQYVREEFSNQEQAELGSRMAECVFWLAQNIPAHKTWEFGGDEQGPPPHLTSPLFDYFIRLRQGISPQHHTLLNQKCPDFVAAYAALLAQPYDADVPAIFGNHDLRPENFLFQKNATTNEWEACAWLDFEGCRVSTPARELRHLARIGPAAVDAGVARYQELSGTTVWADDILFHARAQYMALVLNCIDRGIKQGCLIAKDSLDILYPRNDWSGLTRLF